MLENEFNLKCKVDPKQIWPVVFKHFIDDGFGITKGVREDVIYWIQNSMNCKKNVQIDKYNWGNSLDYIDLYIYDILSKTMIGASDQKFEFDWQHMFSSHRTIETFLPHQSTLTKAIFL